EQITGLWIPDRRLWYHEGNRAVRVEAASRQGAKLGFRWDANNKTDDGCSNSPILKHSDRILVRHHANIKLLARSRVRVPHDPPSAVRRYGRETGYFHCELEVIGRRRLSHRNVVNGQRGRGVSLSFLFRMARRSPSDNQTGAGVADVWRCNLVVRARTSH